MLNYKFTEPEIADDKFSISSEESSTRFLVKSRSPAFEIGTR